jgi:hypothetical protein
MAAAASGGEAGWFLAPRTRILRVRGEATGWPPPRMSPGFASSFISLQGPPDALAT